MGTFLNAEQARDCSRGNAIITEEILLINRHIIDAIANEEREAIIDSASTTTVNGVTVTGTIMTDPLGTGPDYRLVWTNAVTNTTLEDQMTEVIDYFTRNGFSIARVNPTAAITFYWHVRW